MTILTTAIKSQANKWRLFPKVSFRNLRKECPNASPLCWRQWFLIDRYWSGKIINIQVKYYQVVLDFRKNWIADICQ